MAGRVQRDADAVDVNRLAVGNRGDCWLIAEPSARHGQSIMGQKVLAAAPAEMVGVCVSDHGAVDGAPGVDEEAPLFTVETNVGHSEQWVFVQVHVPIIDTDLGRSITPYFVLRARLIDRVNYADQTR